MKPQWTIYKDDQPIGQAVTWHKALDILVTQEKLTIYEVITHSYPFPILWVSTRSKTPNQQVNDMYKIVKERG